MTRIDPSCGETRFPEICAACGENMRWIGKPKARRQVCGCEAVALPVRPKVSTRRKGDKLERRIGKAIPGARMVQGSGASWSRDGSLSKSGDLTASVRGTALRIEAKFRAGAFSGVKTLEAARGAADVLVVESFGERFAWLPFKTFSEICEPGAGEVSPTARARREQEIEG